MNFSAIPSDIINKTVKVFIGNFSFYGECIELGEEEENYLKLKETDDNILLINITSVDVLTIIENE
ncbi:MAG: hypothetical protein IJH63_00450 [Methanobrevibacter sp.]|nr:hypothetical protein [Methanosphaera sp.]MBR0369173.1 hypothetical protein [Methanobrevibacter sp.]